MKLVVALVSGLIFGIGLTISQMVNPYKVLNFLDMTGRWDPSLFFVMGAATGLFSLSFWLIIKHRKRSLSGRPISLPNVSAVNKPLVVGAAIFGVGWGLTGICPGPAMANITGMEPKMIVFILVMIIGMRVAEWVKPK